ncbi:dihydrofolate reductase family protein [Streptomyces sp. NPDC127100]|uniref:dihydrofolate reductase family protein n=1 Tax=Streptomyces sp. NPDC127100 TaxID=3347138 RepID=UPI00364FB38E
MTRIIADISVSLDGFVTGPGLGSDNGLGTGGEALHTWTFVTTGLADAVTVARERAEAASSGSGRDLDVVLMGGGATVGSALDAGLIDTLSLHLAPVVLGAGTPLFTGKAPHTLVQRSVITTTTATHLTYDVLPGGVIR